MSAPLGLNSIYVKRFKAIRSSGRMRMTPLTVFIGNNGSGKSSLIEALETVKTIALEGLDSAMRRWYGFEHVWNLAHAREIDKKSGHPKHPMRFGFTGRQNEKAFRVKLTVGATNLHYDRLRIESYQTAVAGGPFRDGSKFLENGNVSDHGLKETVSGWQFISLSPGSMVDPKHRSRAGGGVVLSPDGSNVAEYLHEIRELDPDAFEGIVETLKFILPFTRRLQPVITSELDRKVYLQLTESGLREKVPGWLFSTGTLRVLALLAVLRHPNPPKVVFIEELENGLDPRTIHLIVEEIRAFVTEGGGQVVATTHSPYLLDLFTLEHLILVERDQNGDPEFRRPANDEELRDWAAEFSPGRLYTMGSLSGSGKR